MQGLVPPELILQIQEYVRRKCRIAQRAFPSFETDEDSVTAALGERLRTVKSQGRTLELNGQVWRWKISFQRLRGRGPHAAETSVGADGLFQIEVEDRQTGSLWRKGLLFQGKMEKDNDRQRLLSQMRAMEELTPQQSMIVEYGESGYRAVPSATLLRNENSLKTIDRQAVRPLGDMPGQSHVGGVNWSNDCMGRSFVKGCGIFRCG